MLSAIELEYLKNPECFGANYAYVLKHRIKQKVSALQEELAFLNSAGFLTESCKNLTEISKNQKSLNQVAFMNQSLKVVLRPGFGPGSSARKAGILDRTILPEHWTILLFES
jgi:hypothetical protein